MYSVAIKIFICISDGEVVDPILLGGPVTGVQTPPSGTPTPLTAEPPKLLGVTRLLPTTLSHYSLVTDKHTNNIIAQPPLHSNNIIAQPPLRTIEMNASTNIITQLNDTIINNPQMSNTISNKIANMSNKISNVSNKIAVSSISNKIADSNVKQKVRSKTTSGRWFEESSDAAVDLTFSALPGKTPLRDIAPAPPGHRYVSCNFLISQPNLITNKVFFFPIGSNCRY